MGTFRWGVPALVIPLLLSLAACEQGPDQMSWARAALERNPALEVVATDAQAGTFTVRMKDGGALRVVRAEQLIAAPPEATATSGTIAAAATTAAAPAAAEPNPTPPPVAQRTDAPSTPPAPAQPAVQPGSLAPQSSASIESASGRVLESGPGYTIKAATSGPSADERARASTFTSAALERRHDPIVCQGAHLLHIDNRNLAFDGDAVDAEDGCEIHITNSHISARGVGISARAANVHIDNSMIEGEQASIDASEGAQVYAGSSAFRGLSRQLDSATVHDLGGNVWN